MGELEGRLGELGALNSRLALRLEEEIQQNEYLSAKLDSIDAEILEEKVQCLTHLAAAKERRAEALQHELAQRDARIAELAGEV